MRNLCVLGWRPHGHEPLYFRGDERYEVYLPFISDELIQKGLVRGWHENIAKARVFEVPVLLTARSFARGFLSDRLRIYPYEDVVLSTQIFKPIRRPGRPPPG